ncbi:hypothetical protein HELRODRAFT_165438 [Helobdella robusta]|uniref:Uncharacterized protein n=1 Tax=Helobdella robusta TaxID=6412 RepID=T1EWS7_HELRO|nr:hypothetical protein HELRODRAFT_165438 [Helobdella robusta]ESN91407.1 hypothetical protein HELRODRAFT_165438 [Helobdella robusta]
MGYMGENFRPAPANTVGQYEYMKYTISHPDQWCILYTAKRYCRKLERLYRRTLSSVHRESWVGSLKAKHKLYSDKSTGYWNNLIRTLSSQRDKWRLLRLGFVEVDGRQCSEKIRHEKERIKSENQQN